MEHSVILLGVTVQGLRQPQLLAYEEGEELGFRPVSAQASAPNIYKSLE